MSTANNTINVATTSGRGATILWRFVWKEFRMLRGLWLAVAFIGFAVQCVAKMLLPPASDFPTVLFSTALASAVLYAAGAAAMMFSVEHEEETYNFLSNLPTTWWPMFVGKLLVAAGSAIVLTVALSIMGAMLCGNGKVMGANSAVLGVLGIGMLEALAWGTFFSLVVRRPLVAAFLTLVVGAVVTNIIVNELSAYAAASSDPHAYVEAIPTRLAIAAAVLLCSALIARGWLVAGARPAMGARLFGKEGFASRAFPSFGKLAPFGRKATRGTRRRMLARLLWQTWRESWKLLFLPLGVAVVLLFAFAAFNGLVAWNDEGAQFFLTSMWLFVPALYGALAFHADQRRGNYQFLAEHAARPRYVWFARHVVWLGCLVAVGTLVIVFLAALAGTRLGFTSWQFVRDYAYWGRFQLPRAETIVYDLANASDYVVRFLCLAMWACLVAYSIGQFCSMTMRSEILAAFVSLVLSIVVAAWMAVLLAWQLPSWLFLFPLFAGFMLATWLRAPGWIAGRKSLRSWLKPALAIAVPIVFIAMVLPTARIVQVPLGAYYDNGKSVQANVFVPQQLQLFQSGNTPEARETADMYIKAAERLASDTFKNPLAPWEKEGEPPVPEETLESTIPADQLPAYRAAKKELERLRHEDDLATVRPAVEASKRPACRFDFDSRSIGVRPNNLDHSRNLTKSCPIYGKLVDLLDKVALTPLDPEKPFDSYLAALRMSNHLRSGQPSVIYIDQLERERNILDWITNRAREKSITKDQLRDVIEKLLAQFHSEPSPVDSLVADDSLVRNVLTGKDTPLILAGAPGQPPVMLHDYLAFLANELPWEQFRAMHALDWITYYSTRDVKELVEFVRDSRPNDWLPGQELHRWLRPRFSFSLPESWAIQMPAVTTSYLASLEYVARVSVAELNRAYCDTEVCRRATLIQIALAMYRLDHKAYPPRLTDLVPEYLKELPLDPYGRQSFQYLPTGLELPLDGWQSGATFHRIDPHTPFFWSVGIDNVRLQQLLRQPQPDVPDADTTASAPGAAAPEVGAPPDAEHESAKNAELVYVLVADDDPRGGDSIFVFPLPE